MLIISAFHLVDDCVDRSLEPFVLNWSKEFLPFLCIYGVVLLDIANGYPLLKVLSKSIHGGSTLESFFV